MQKDVLFIVMLNVIMLNVVMLNVVMLSVMVPQIHLITLDHLFSFLLKIVPLALHFLLETLCAVIYSVGY